MIIRNITWKTNQHLQQTRINPPPPPPPPLSVYYESSEAQHPSYGGPNYQRILAGDLGSEPPHDMERRLDELDGELHQDGHAQAAGADARQQ